MNEPVRGRLWSLGACGAVYATRAWRLQRLLAYSRFSTILGTKKIEFSPAPRLIFSDKFYEILTMRVMKKLCMYVL